MYHRIGAGTLRIRWSYPESLEPSGRAAFQGTTLIVCNPAKTHCFLPGYWPMLWHDYTVEPQTQGFFDVASLRNKPAA